MELFLGVFSALIGLFGVWLGSYFTTKNGIKLEKKFLAKQLRISKNQEITEDLLDYMRGVAEIQVALLRLCKSELTLDEFRALNDRQQGVIASLQRKLVVNKVFINDNGIDTQIITDLTFDYCNRIYDGFHFPEGKKKIFDGEQVAYRTIENKLHELTFVINDMITELNIKLNNEIKELE